MVHSDMFSKARSKGCMLRCITAAWQLKLKCCKPALAELRSGDELFHLSVFEGHLGHAPAGVHAYSVTRQTEHVLASRAQAADTLGVCAHRAVALQRGALQRVQASTLSACAEKMCISPQ